MPRLPKGRSVRRTLRITPAVAAWLAAEADRRSAELGAPVSGDDVIESWVESQIAATDPDLRRIHVADLDPETLVGIRPCDDGEEGWVVLQCVEEVDPSDMVVIEPVGDEHGQIVYMDINDAAEVLRTGKVWKHDMGEGEADD